MYLFVLVSFIKKLCKWLLFSKISAVALKIHLIYFNNCGWNYVNGKKILKPARKTSILFFWVSVNPVQLRKSVCHYRKDFNLAENRKSSWISFDSSCFVFVAFPCGGHGKHFAMRKNMNWPHSLAALCLCFTEGAADTVVGIQYHHSSKMAFHVKDLFLVRWLRGTLW